jgi:hypothetical protein
MKAFADGGELVEALIALAGELAPQREPRSRAAALLSAAVIAYGRAGATRGEVAAWCRRLGDKIASGDLDALRH